MSLTNTTTINLNPPVVLPQPSTDIPIGIFVAVFVAIIGVFVIWWLMRKGSRIKDVDPSLSQLMADPYDPNKAAVIMMLVTFPVMMGLVYGLAFLFGPDMLIGVVIIVSCVLGTLLPYYIAKLNSREKTRNMKKLDGPLYLADGSKTYYSFSNVVLHKPRFFTDAQKDAIKEAAPKYKHLIDDSPLEMVRAEVGEGFNVYFAMTRPEAESIQWVPTDEFDYYGSFTIPTGSPVLFELAKLPRVQFIEDDEKDMKEFYNENVFVFLFIFDDSHAQKILEKIAPIDLTQDKVSMAVGKALNVDKKVVAGMLNTNEDELAGYKNDERSFDTKVSNRANGIAAGMIADKEALSMLGWLDESTDLKGLLVWLIIFIFGAILGFSLGG